MEDYDLDIDVEALLAQLATPHIPSATIDGAHAALAAVRSWKRTYVAPILAGLLTEPTLHANGIRIDWLQRIVLAEASGRRKPDRVELTLALNAGLGHAGVLRLEDPNEDLFCERVVTDRGNFRIFPGQWELAAPYTQTVLDAFESLPDSRLKKDALEAVYSLLQLSEALADRSAVHPQTVANGRPMAAIALPQPAALARLARRVRFTASELHALGIDQEALAPFFLDPRQYQIVAHYEPGEAPIEFHPLLLLQTGVVVASPANMSIAVRSVLVNAAVMGSIGDLLLERIMERQEEYSELSLFWPVPHLKLSPRNRHSIRSAIVEFAQGRFLHVIQVPSTFDDFPSRGFASIRPLSAEANRCIGEGVRRFWLFLERRHDVRQAVTVLLMSGWGAPHSVRPEIDESNTPDNWQFLSLSFADAATLGACENGKFQDVCRLVEQADRLGKLGFTFHNVNGILNLFAHWRTTAGNLVPEHMAEMVPPCNIMLPTDGLLEPRSEAARNRDPQALPLPSGSYRRVQLKDWNDEGKRAPVYASAEEAMAGNFLGAVVVDGRIWWVECTPRSLETREWCYRVWEAALQWLSAVGGSIISQYPEAFPEAPSVVKLLIPESVGSMRGDRAAFTGQLLATTLTEEGSLEERPPSVSIAPAWIEHLWEPENDAEIELTAAVLAQLACAASCITRVSLRKAVRKAIGSTDWRWLHAQPVITPLDHLRMNGLISPFHEPSFSAAALSRCCSIWKFRDPVDGFEIAGEDACSDFLARYRDDLLELLVNQVNRFDRCELIRAAADAYQSARVEQQIWRGTIKAMRAIHGGAADQKAFKRQNAINAVQRAAKTVCEIAACEAASSDALHPGPVDLDELFALTLLLVGNGQLFSAIKGGLLKPTLRISPAGDLLSDRSIFEKTLRPGAEWLNTRMLEEAAQSYSAVRSGAGRAGSQGWETGLRGALEAEYGVSAESFASLQYDVAALAEARGKSVIMMRRSELSAALPPREGDRMPLLKRLTLARRSSWTDRTEGLSESDIDFGRFDRPLSLINRPLLALEDADDPLLSIVPLFVSDATMYSLSGLMAGTLQGKYWRSKAAVAFAGRQADAAGAHFEDRVTDALTDLGLWARQRCELGWVLNQKVDPALGNIDVLAVSSDRRRVWVIEAKNLRLCRTETEVAARLSEYRGRMVVDSKGRERPDKLLRHLRRVKYLRERNVALCQRLGLEAPPTVKGLLIVDAPQPMNFYMLEDVPDAESVYLDEVRKFDF